MNGQQGVGRSIEFGGVRIDDITLGRAAANALHMIESRQGQVVFACANPHSIVVAQTDRTFFNALNAASVVVADGVGVSALSRLAGIRLQERITGMDYFTAVCSLLHKRGKGRVFFFGSSQRVLDLIRSRFHHDFPSVTLCGVLSPPFGTWSTEDNAAMIQNINASNPDVLWVGMTAPKQECWVEANRNALNVPVIGSIGAVFDFYAGTYSRAPRWVCWVGLEWAYRLILEPRRLWRRNFVSGPRFVMLAIRDAILGGPGSVKR